MADPRVKGEKGRTVFQEVFGDMPLPDNVSASTLNYEDYWKERKEKNIVTEPAKRRARGILPFIKEGDTVLDIGCGTGETLEVLRNERKIKGTASKSE